jgi:hypothetical protein
VHRRSQAEKETRDHRGDNREQQYSEINGWDVPLKKISRANVNNQDNKPLAQKQAGNAAENAKGEAFSKHLGHNARTGRAKRQPYRHFLFSFCSTSQQQICDVRARDQQDKDNGSLKKQQPFG